MTMKRFITRSLAMGGALILLGAGCIQFTGSGSTGLDGGIFKSGDKGESWTQVSAIATAEGPKSLGGQDITALAQDPGEAKTLYAGTALNGLFVTLDGAAEWTQVDALAGVGIAAAAVSPGNKCHIFVASGNRILRSVDCARTFQNVYLDPRADAFIRDIEIDHFNSETVYAASSKGDLLKSTDNGGSWSPVHRFQTDIRQILMRAGDSRVIYVATKHRGLWKTTDGGAEWAEINEGLGDFSGSTDNLIMAEVPAAGDSIIIGSNHGLLRTKDGGATWESIPLLTPPGSTAIHSLAVSPKDPNAIYYGTASTFYRSVDGGVRWVTSTNPTSRAATTLLVDRADDSVLYMGTTQLRQSSTPF